MSVVGVAHATGQGALIACHVPSCRTCFLDGRDGAVLPGGLAVCDACAEREEVCRNGHALAKTDDAVWSRFVLLGIQRDDVENLELRNCPVCRSSIARFVAVSDPCDGDRYAKDSTPSDGGEAPEAPPAALFEVPRVGRCVSCGEAGECRRGCAEHPDSKAIEQHEENPQ